MSTELLTVSTKKIIQKITASASFEEISILINNCTNLLEKDKSGLTVLYYGVAYGRLDVIELLLNKGVYIDIPNDTGYTPLESAVKIYLSYKKTDLFFKESQSEIYLKIIFFLIDRGASLKKIEPDIINLYKESRELQNLLNDKKYMQKTIIQYTNAEKKKIKNKTTALKKQAREKYVKEITQLNNNFNKTMIDELLQDSINLEIFKNPHISAPDGNTCSLESISQWLEKNGTHPFTRNKTSLSDFIPNKLIIEFVKNLIGGKEYSIEELKSLLICAHSKEPLGPNAVIGIDGMTYKDEAACIAHKVKIHAPNLLVRQIVEHIQKYDQERDNIKKFKLEKYESADNQKKHAEDILFKGQSEKLKIIDQEYLKLENEIKTKYAQKAKKQEHHVNIFNNNSQTFYQKSPHDALVEKIKKELSLKQVEPSIFVFVEQIREKRYGEALINLYKNITMYTPILSKILLDYKDKLPNFINQCDQEGFTAIYYAAKNKDSVYYYSLRNAGADENLPMNKISAKDIFIQTFGHAPDKNFQY